MRDSASSFYTKRALFIYMGSSELETTLQGVAALFIVTAGVEKGADLAIATAASAKKAGVKHVLAVAVPNLNKDTLSTPEFYVETKIKALGEPYTFLRLPMFLENYFGFKDTIKGAGAIYLPVDPTKPCVSVVVADAGNAAARYW